MGEVADDSKTDYYFGVDLVRFAAALMVTVFHLGFASWASPTFPNQIFTFPEIAAMAQPGWVGVPIFFVVSGFVVVGAASTGSALDFAINRALRLYPAVWICASLTLVLLLMDGSTFEIWEKYLRSITLYPFGPWIDGQYWTLATEIGFYTIIFFCILAKRMEFIRIIAISLLLASAIWVLNLIFLESYRLDQLFRVRLFPFSAGCHFAAGIFLYLWSKNRLTRKDALPLLASLIVGGIGIYLDAVDMGERTSTMAGTGFSNITPILFWLTGIGSIALSIFYKNRLYRLAKPWREFLRTLGLMTYPLYLLHFAIGVAMIREMVRWGVTPYLALVVTILLLCGASYLICHYFEPQIRRGFRNMIMGLRVRLRNRADVA